MATSSPGPEWSRAGGLGSQAVFQTHLLNATPEATAECSCVHDGCPPRPTARLSPLHYRCDVDKAKLCLRQAALCPRYKKIFALWLSYLQNYLRHMHLLTLS